ncbi:hypothetical protein [Pseudomonas aeruginosa]|uniref:hypothetical protein n=1 Tax=Pseudomonas aeruginosa TaxID=287 RepID=UPI002E2B7B21|nr:hypothetical protein [Pseudomonas aeruginosa]
MTKTRMSMTLLCASTILVSNMVASAEWCGVGYLRKITYNPAGLNGFKILIDMDGFISKEDIKKIKEKREHFDVSGDQYWITVEPDKPPKTQSATDNSTEEHYKSISDYMEAMSVIESAFYTHTPIAVKKKDANGTCRLTTSKMTVTICSRPRDCKDTSKI